MKSLAFIGFGEAAQSMAKGLAAEAMAPALAAYDPRIADPAAAPALEQAARASGTRLAPTLAEAVDGADVAFSLVVGSAAEAVGREAGKAMHPSQTLIDFNSISPIGKRAVGKALEESAEPPRFIEGAIMARVTPYGHKVPILLAGPDAEAVSSGLNAWGMQTEAVGDAIGQACAVKMIRSVVVKGIEALLLESLTAAERAGVRERILDSITETFPGIDWRRTATYHLGRTQIHGKRRVTEMNESAATLREYGLEPVLSEAIARTIGSAHARFAASDAPAEAEYDVLLRALAAGGDDGASRPGAPR